jgi:hypothetical protein
VSRVWGPPSLTRSGNTSGRTHCPGNAGKLGPHSCVPDAEKPDQMPSSIRATITQPQPVSASGIGGGAARWVTPVVRPRFPRSGCALGSASAGSLTARMSWRVARRGAPARSAGFNPARSRRSNDRPVSTELLPRQPQSVYASDDFAKRAAGSRSESVLRHCPHSQKRRQGGGVQPVPST